MMKMPEEIRAEAEEWNSRPIEDALTQRINDLESALHATATGKR
jgi:hypothetical protein